MSKLVNGYVYDSAGYFLGITPVQEDPKSPATFLLPGNTTVVRPPLESLTDTEIPQWDGERWAVVPVPVPEVPAEYVPTIEEIREMALRRVDSLVIMRREFGFLYLGTRYQADEVMVQNINGIITAAMAGVPIPFPFIVRTSGNIDVGFYSLAELVAFSGAMLVFLQTIFVESWAAKDAIRAATMKAAIDSIVGSYFTP